MSWSVVGGPYNSVFIAHRVSTVTPAPPTPPPAQSTGSRGGGWSIIGGPYKSVFAWTRRVGGVAVVPPPPPPPPGVGVGTGAGAGGGVRRAGRILDVGDTEYEKKKRIEEEIHALFRERERKAKEAKATQIKLAYEHKASLDAKLERILRRMADIEIEIQVLRAKRETIDNAEMEEVMEVYLVSRMVH